VREFCTHTSIFIYLLFICCWQDDEAGEEDPSKMGMRFLLLCAEESLCIYTVPDYDQLARVETKHPILSSHIVSLNGKAAASSTTPPLRRRA
jgi:hypothetical protein